MINNKPSSKVELLPYKPRQGSHAMNASQLGSKTLFATTYNKEVGDGKYQDVRYFSGIDAEIYFEDLFIDEAIQIHFEVSQNTMPLLGYNSYVYDDIALGSRMVQGSFAINFTKAGYMYEVLETLKSLNINSGNSRMPGIDENTLSDFDVKRTNNKLLAYEKAPLWDKRFSIILSYGDSKISNAPLSTMLELTGVQLTGCSQQFASSGEPILEVYSFIARDIQFVPITVGGNNSAGKKEDTIPKDKEVISIKSISYNEEITKSMSLENEELAIKYYEQYRKDPVHLYTDSASGYISMEFNTSIEIIDVLIKPKLSVKNRRSSSEAISLKKGNKKLTSPIKFLVDKKLREDIKEHHNIYGNGQMFGVDIEVIYREKNEELHKSFSGVAKIQNVLEKI
jgi:hypothetical protein